MNCTNARESISADLDGELGDDDRRPLADHLETSAACAAFALRAEQLRRSMRVTSMPDLPDLVPAVMATAGATKAAAPPAMGPLFVRYALLVLGAVGLAVALPEVWGGLHGRPRARNAPSRGVGRRIRHRAHRRGGATGPGARPAPDGDGPRRRDDRDHVRRRRCRPNVPAWPSRRMSSNSSSSSCCGCSPASRPTADRRAVGDDAGRTRPATAPRTANRRCASYVPSMLTARARDDRPQAA